MHGICPFFFSFFFFTKFDNFFHQGEKVFYLVKPTDQNLKLYEEWASSPKQSEIFLGSTVDGCYKTVVKQGQTLFIPTGNPF